MASLETIANFLEKDTLSKLFETKVTRRIFCIGAVTLPVTLSARERSQIRAQEIVALKDLIANKGLSQLEFNPASSLVNTLFIEDGLGYGWWTRKLDSERAKNVIAVARFPGMYRKENGEVTIMTETRETSLSDGSNLYGQGDKFQRYPRDYGEGKRFLVVELPYDEYISQVDSGDFASYVYDLVAWYHPTHIVLGNELNVPGSIWTPSQYSDYACTAAQEIKGSFVSSVSSTKVLLYGDAYYGNGEFLNSVLGELRNRGSLHLFAGVNFHFYDRAGKLPGRLYQYHRLLTNFFGPKYHFSIYMTEIGKKEDGRNWPEIPHVRTVIQEAAVACALADKNRQSLGLPAIEDFFWHTAFMPKKYDPGGHSLTYLENEGDGPEGEKHPKWAFYALMIVCRLLHHNVSLEYPNGDDSIILVRGATSKNQPVEIIWDSRPTEGDSLEGKPQIYLDGRQIY